MLGMRIELITQENCPKCDWFKEYILPALRLKGYEVKEFKVNDYDLNFLINFNIEYTPTLLIWNDKKELLILDKGLTLKNVENKIKEHYK